MRKTGPSARWNGNGTHVVPPSWLVIFTALPTFGGPNHQKAEPLDMLAELRDDNQALTERLREAHNVCDEHRDVATASLIEVWIDEAERRTWFLFEMTRGLN